MTGNTSKEQLQSIVERIERLTEEKTAIADDIKAVFAEAKANGFDTKALRQIIRDRKMEQSDREEYEAILDSYRAALGMLPLWEAAEEDGAPEATISEKAKPKRPKKQPTAKAKDLPSGFDIAAEVDIP